jgi:hypothetical protein
MADRLWKVVEWGNYDREAFICLLSRGLPGGAMENDLPPQKKKKISMPGNVDRGFNRGHCQFAAKK